MAKRFFILISILLFTGFGCQEKSKIATTGADPTKESAVSAKKVPIEPSWYKTGQNFKAKVSLTSDLIMMAPLRMDKTDLKKTVMVLNYKVIEADQQQATIEITVESIHATMVTIGRKFGYDSEDVKVAKSISNPENKKGAKQQQDKFANSFSEVKGQKYIARINRDGQVISLDIQGNILKKEASGQPRGEMIGGDQLTMLFNEYALKAYASPLLWSGAKDFDADKNQELGLKTTVVLPFMKPFQLNRKVSTVSEDSQTKIDYTLALTESEYSTVKEGKVYYTPKEISPDAKGNAIYSKTHLRVNYLNDSFKLKINSLNLPAQSKGKNNVVMLYTYDRTIEPIETIIKDKLNN
ncbi:MAG: hypothetical protein JEZ07_01055 [Phycisphaerae bacterium]|nr:hypothetical protein [Phycisphaerae bacterium]